MKTCKGCGIKLQDKDPYKKGYVLNSEQDYCQRCFRLTHYGDLDTLKNEVVNNDDIYQIYNNYKNAVFILIVEVFDALILDIDNLLDIFKDKKLILIINKIDLLPYNVKDNKMETLLKEVLSKCKTDNIINCLLTYKDDYTFNNLFFDTIDELDQNEFVFVGRVNAGKSTIINKLLKNNDLTVSSFPGTTIDTNVIKCEDYTFIDTPGIIDETSFIKNIDNVLVKKLIPNKCIKPKVFQLYEQQSYFVEGLIEINIEPVKNASISFFIRNDLQIHRSGINSLDNYRDKHLNEKELKLLPLQINRFYVTKKQCFFVKGLGYFTINGKSNVNIRINPKIKIYKCEVNL